MGMLISRRGLSLNFEKLATMYIPALLVQQMYITICIYIYLEGHHKFIVCLGSSSEIFGKGLVYKKVKLARLFRSQTCVYKYKRVCRLTLF